MTDTLRDRIAAVLREHVEDQLTNYDAGRNECGCGNQGLSGYVEHVADAVIAELGLQEQTILSTAPGADLGGGIELTPSEFDEFLRLAREP